VKNYFAKLVSGENRQYLNWVWNYKKIFLLVPLAIALVWAYRHFGIFDYADKGLDIGAWEVFFNIFGTVYAVIAGLILVDEFQRHAQLKEKLELELNALQDIRDFLEYMDVYRVIGGVPCKTKTEKDVQLQAKAEIRHALFTYSLSILSKDWPLMRQGKRNLDSDTTDELKGLMLKINSLVIGKDNESDKVALSSMMSLVADITTLRTQRITIVNSSVPVQLKYLIHLMGSILVLGIMLLGIHNLYLHLLLTFFSSSIILVIYLLFEDLHRPFEGQWKISSSGFYQYLAKMLTDLGNSALFSQKDKMGEYFELKKNETYSVVFGQDKNKINIVVDTKRAETSIEEEIKIYDKYNFD
jgi:hypothetical protein